MMGEKMKGKPCECKFLLVQAGLVKIEVTQVKGFIIAHCAKCPAQYKVNVESMARMRIYAN